MSIDPLATTDAAVHQVNEAEWAKVERWKWGMFYYSHLDSRIWVPKRTLLGRKHRIGTTPNFAKPEARRYVLIVSVILSGMMLALLVLKRLGII